MDTVVPSSVCLLLIQNPQAGMTIQLDALVHKLQSGLDKLLSILFNSVGGVLSLSVVDMVAKTAPLGAMCCYTSLLWLNLTTVIAVTLPGEGLPVKKNLLTTTQYTFGTQKSQITRGE